MEYRKFPQGYVVRLDPGEEVLECLTELVKRENIALGSVSALGASRDITIGLFDTEEKRYTARRFQGEYEIASLIGSVTQMNGKPYFHLHIVIGNPMTGETHAGHMNSCTVSATLELFLHTWDGQVDRQFSEQVGLNLFKFE
ncbi:hypothetical protein SDC9_143101 [bioreactor metagenome]|uniref:PPC domain-containing protein n=1 Tax=bioreactor metagenome TaxID=1076179 RepID=A0A645E335_9ZZZZ